VPVASAAELGPAVERLLNDAAFREAALADAAAMMAPFFGRGEPPALDRLATACERIALPPPSRQAVSRGDPELHARLRAARRLLWEGGTAGPFFQAWEELTRLLAAPSRPPRRAVRLALYTIACDLGLLVREAGERRAFVERCFAAARDNLGATERDYRGMGVNAHLAANGWRWDPGEAGTPVGRGWPALLQTLRAVVPVRGLDGPTLALENHFTSLERECSQARDELTGLKRSWAFKTGKLLVWLPSRLKRGVRRLLKPHQSG
jgi:hypothetical protein